MATRFLLARATLLAMYGVVALSLHRRQVLPLAASTHVSRCLMASIRSQVSNMTQVYLPARSIPIRASGNPPTLFTGQTA